MNGFFLFSKIGICMQRNISVLLFFFPQAKVFFLFWLCESPLDLFKIFKRCVNLREPMGREVNREQKKNYPPPKKPSTHTHSPSLVDCFITNSKNGHFLKHSH